MEGKQIERYVDLIPVKTKILMKIWLFTSYILFKPFFGRVFNSWRIFILKIFGAKVGKGSIIYSSCVILCPWNLEIGNETCLGPEVKTHIGRIKIGNKVTISQRTYLCSGSHDISSLNTPFYSAPIIIEDFAWIAAEAFIVLGVHINEGAIVGARAAVFNDVEAWTVVGGNPAKFIKKRELKGK